MLKTFKKKRPKNKVKNKKRFLIHSINKSEQKKEILDYRKGRY